MMILKTPRHVDYRRYPTLVLARRKFLRGRGDIRFAIAAWLFCRETGAPVPDWTLATMDYSERIASLVPPLAQAKPKRPDEAKRGLSRRKELELFMDAWGLYWSHPRISEGCPIDWLRVPPKILPPLKKHWEKELKAEATFSGKRTRASANGLTSQWRQ